MSSTSSKLNYIIYLDIFLLLIGLAGIYHIVLRAGFNPSTKLKLSASETERLVVDQIVDETLQDHIQVGDTLLGVNNHIVRTTDELEMVTDAVAIGSQLTIRISRQGTYIHPTVTSEKFYSWYYISIATVVGLIFLSLGVFVLIKKPDDPAARIYHWVSLSVAMIIMTTWGRYTVMPMGLGYLLRIVFCSAYALTPVMFIHFALIFPGIKWVSYKKLLIPLYAIAILFFLWTSISFLLAVIPVPSIHKIRFYLTGFDSNRWFFAACIFSGVLLILHSMVKAVETEERKKILWLMVGLIVGPLSFAGLWLIPQALGISATIPEESILLIAAIIPLTFSISIVRHHAMDIYFLVNRSTVYIIVVSLVLGLYALIIASAMAVIDRFTTESSIITSAFATIILALLFDPVRKKVQNFVDKKFFRVKYNYRIAQRNFTDEMNNSIDQKSMAISLVEKLEQLMSPLCLGLMTKNENEPQLKLSAQKNCTEIDGRFINILQDLVNQSSENIFSIEEELEPGIPFKSLDLAHQENISLAISSRTQNGTLLGLLFLGRKRAGTRYSMEDMDLLKTAMTQFGFAIERIRLQSQLYLKQQEARELNELNQMQSFFISGVSHDLQTPLTSIRMYIDFLQEREGLSEQKKREYLQTIAGESNRLSKLINNVLDVSLIERGVMTSHFENVNLKKLLQDIFKSMQYDLDLHHFETFLELPEEKICGLYDKDLLERAIVNLISNAIKYSGREKYLAIRLITTEKETGIEITDRGIGIDPTEQKKIYDMFYRIRDKNIQAVGGAGLGLAIVHHVANAHNGRIDLESQLGRGSVFTLWLPNNPDS